MLFRRDPLPVLLPRLRRLALALCRDRTAADDLVQDTLARALTKQQRFDGTNLPAWLCTIMVNLFRNNRRQFSRLPMLVDLDQAANQQALSAESGTGEDMRRALGQLPEDQRVAILLLALEGQSYKEIAEIQGVPIGTVMSRISRARENLRLALEPGSATVKQFRKPLDDR